MSLILEALQRAERDRKPKDDIPGIDADHATDVAAGARSAQDAGKENRRRFATLAILLATIGLLLAYIVYLNSRPAVSQAAATPTASTPTPASTATQKEATDEEPTTETTSVKQPTQLALANPEPQAGTQLAELSAEDAGSNLNRSNKILPQPITQAADVSNLYEQAKQRPTETVASAAPANETIDRQVTNTINDARVDEANIIPQSESAADDKEDVYADIPFARELPRQQQNAIPSIRYTTHGYAADTGKGVATLNGRTLRNGDSLADGIVVLDIKADYIVLDMNGTLFRLPAAEDWGL